MANAPRKRPTRGKAKNTAPKPAADTTDTADAPVPGADDNFAQDQAKAAADKAAEKEAKEKAEAERQEKLADFKGKLGDVVEDLQNRDKSDAVAMRELGVKVGQCLIEGKALFTKEGSNEINNQAYGKWLTENFPTLGSRPTKLAYEWLANVHDLNPDLYALFPTDPEGDEPVMRTPRSLRNWFDKELSATFQMCFDLNADMAVPDFDEDAAKRKEWAKDQIENVKSDADDHAGFYREEADKAFDSMKGKSGNVLKEAQKSHEEAEQKAAQAERRVNLLMNITNEEAAAAFAKWKPSIPAVKFVDMVPAAAAVYLFDTLKKHEEMADVLAELDKLVEEALAKVADDDGDVSDDDDTDDVTADADDVDDIDEEEDGDDFDDFEDDFEEDEDAA